MSPILHLCSWLPSSLPWESMGSSFSLWDCHTRNTSMLCVIESLPFLSLTISLRPGCWRCCVFFYFLFCESTKIHTLYRTESPIESLSDEEIKALLDSLIDHSQGSLGLPGTTPPRVASRTRHRTQVYHAQWFRTFYNASCLIANVYTHTWRQWQAPTLSRNYPKYISTIPYLLSSLMETSVSTTWDWEQMARFGFLTGAQLVCTHNGLNMPRLWHMMVKTRRVGALVYESLCWGQSKPSNA